MIPEPVPVEQIVSGGCRFRCTVYAATLSAAACVKRQTMAHGNPMSDFLSCRRCPIGREVAKRVDVEAIDAAEAAVAKDRARRRRAGKHGSRTLRIERAWAKEEK